MMEVPRIKVVESSADRLTFVGTRHRGGTYLLRMRLSRAADVIFGSFDKGRTLRVPSGEYQYVGSAMAEAGALCLAWRLYRHASRLGTGKPHPIRELMESAFPRLGLIERWRLKDDEGKHSKWNVDHLLDLNSLARVRATVNA